MRYAYGVFLHSIAGLYPVECWVRPVLLARGGDVRGSLLPCDGILDGHHLVRKSTLTTELGLSKADGGAVLNDGRNGVFACRRHHDLIEGCAVRLERGELPMVVDEFAAAHGLGWWLDRTYGAREDVAA